MALQRPRVPERYREALHQRRLPNVLAQCTLYQTICDYGAADAVKRRYKHGHLILKPGRP